MPARPPATNRRRRRHRRHRCPRCATILRLVDQGKLTHWGDDWVGHTGQIIGWESFAAYNVRTGDAIVLMVNETGFLPDALLALLGVANPELRLKLAAAR